MSWASGRKTKRAEDIAYSLLGIFDINMPMLYGEGMKAFLRLQENIIRHSTDMSLFAWTDTANTQSYTGLLASSPDYFQKMHGLVPQPDALLELRDYSITNRGIRFNMPLSQDLSSGYLILPINHGYVEQQNRGVYLRQVGMDLFVRARPHELPHIDLERLNTPFHMMKDNSFHVKTLTSKQSALIEDRVLQIAEPQNLQDLGIRSVQPAGSWSLSERSLYAGHTGVFLAYIHFAPPWSDEFDSFVLVCYFGQYGWQYHLVRGDDWLDIRPEFYDYYRNGNHLQAADLSLDLPHLYEEEKKKIVRVEIVNGSSDDSKAGLRLLLEDNCLE
jgi:hypothetical protein